MNPQRIHRITGGFVFLYAFLVYFMTMAETVSFWDCGEFIAISHGLQVSHPPGAPFYMLVGRFFSMFAPTGMISWSVNLVSVLCSSFTALLTYLIVVRLIQEWKGELEAWRLGDMVAGFGGGAVAALTFAVTDSHWFNSVEAEVYAISMLFTALVVWLIFEWVDQVRHEEAKLGRQLGTVSSRWLILIAYLFGLATGVHLLNLLAIFFIGLIIFYEKFDQVQWDNSKRFKGIVMTGLLSSVIFFLIYPGIIQTLPSIAEKVGAPTFVFLAFIVLLVAGVWYTQKNRMQLLNLFFICLAVVTIGYSTYALIFIRSAANPPIDENDPETAESIVSYLKREQYGATPLLSGPSYDNATGQIASDKSKLFPRRWSDQSPEHLREYAKYSSDWSFFWSYQVGHMYVRYFLWNFVGKAGDFREASWTATPQKQVLEAMSSPSEKKSHNTYYALPLLLGLIGLWWHIRQDWRRAFASGILFFVMGIGIILYLNQPPGQPRERDYAYVGSFWVFAFWIGIGATALMELVAASLAKMAETAKTGAIAGVLALCFVAVPGWMLVENYADHNRKGERVAWDYAYNMINSVEKNAIIFTNGDNDTFPLWYLQEVEGIRRDVRVVNLSLLQTPWYIRQLKNQSSRDSAPLPIVWTDAQIKELGICGIMSQEVAQQIGLTSCEQTVGGIYQETSNRGEKAPGLKVSLPVQAKDFAAGGQFAASMADSLQVPQNMEWIVKGHAQNEALSLLFPNDQAVLHILQTNAQQGWKRPIYFAVTVSPDGLVDAEDYFQLEGLATRVVPIKHREAQGRVVPSVALERLKNFRFTGLDNPNIYFDENIRGLTDNYRTIYLQVAEQLGRTGRVAEAEQLLNQINQKVRMEVIPADFYSLYMFSETYRALKNTAQAQTYLKKAEEMAIRGYKAGLDPERADTYLLTVWQSHMRNAEFDKAAAFGQRVMRELGVQDEQYRMNATQLKQLYEETQQMYEEEKRQANTPDTAHTTLPEAPPQETTTIAPPTGLGPMLGPTTGN